MEVEKMLDAPLKVNDFLDSIDLTAKPKTPLTDRSPESRSSRDRDRDSDRRRRRSRSRDRRSHDGRSDAGRSSSDRHSRRRRSRSRSPYSRERRRRDDRYDDRERERDRDRARRYDDRRRRSRTRSRSRTPPPKRRRDSPSYDARSPPRERSPEMSVEEHEMRSVFVQQLSARVGERELFQFFEAQAGPVRDAKLIVDRISRRSKGVGYVEFRDLDTMPKALALSGTRLMGVPILVQYTEAERNRMAQAATAETTSSIVVPPGSDAHPNAPIPYNRLYVGSLNFNLTDADIRQVFQPFGQIDFVDLHRDQNTGKSKGYCFVQFRNHKDAVTALEKMNNFQIAGRPIKVGLVTEKVTQMAARDSANPNLDENERGGNLSGISRIELMHKLSRQGELPTTEVVTSMSWKANIPTAATKCILLQNMFNASEETEPNWDSELRDDVNQEVTDKYGAVSDIFLVKDSEGEIYIKFESEEASAKALAGLNGRFFGGRKIGASFISDAIFSASKRS